jgi:hypothetical protein
MDNFSNVCLIVCDDPQPLLAACSLAISLMSAAIGSHSPKVETASGTKPIPRDKHAPWHLATFASAAFACAKLVLVMVGIKQLC